jgi:hypothetical protein
MKEWNIDEEKCRIKSFGVGVLFGIVVFILLSGYKIIYIH